MDTTSTAHEHPPQCAGASDQMAVAASINNGNEPVVVFGSKQALFSTHQAAVQVANYWRSRYPRIGWCVFPDCAWEIEDLWDDQDIHTYTPKLCREALQFLARDNSWTAKKFAEDWARAHPEHLAAAFGKSSMAAMYDPAQPLDIVDKIFIFGEHNLLPRQFLYHAADILRTAMLEDEARKDHPMATTNLTSPPVTSKFSDKQQDAVKPPSASKKNRKKSRSRPQRLTESTEPAGRPHRRQEPTLPYGENFLRSVYTSRGPSGSYPPVHSPHLNQVAITMGPGQPPMPKSQLHPAHLHHPQHSGFIHSNMLPPHHVHPDYTQQVLGNHGLRSVTMGDVTNNTHPQYMDPGRAGRREKSLYDPYNGARPAFNDYGGGRKASRGGFMEQSIRKASVQGPRPRIGSSGTDWGESASNSYNFADSRPLRHHMKDDPVMINDAIRGCGQNWIGPENHDVTELFIGELPEHTQQHEIELMFLHLVNVTPVRAIVKIQPGVQRGHAFVMFNDASDAKLALRANDSEPHIRGTRLRITVPRRFFQKANDYTNPPHRVAATITKPTGTTITTSSSTTQPLYTSQDARSDLQKEVTEMSKTTGTPQAPSPELHPEGKATEMRKTMDTEKVPSPELTAEVKMLVIDPVVEKAESPMQLDSSPSKTSEKTIDMSPDDDNDSKIIAVEPHVDAGKSVSLGSSPQQTTTGGHVRVESQTKATFEETESTVDGSTAAKAAVVKVPEPSKEDGVHDPTKKDSECIAQPTSSASTAPTSTDLKNIPAHLQQPVEAAISASYADAVKQHGPPQTQSLNPFAKPSKAQREKNKKLKKREQKRECKTTQADVAHKATSAQEMAAAPSIEVLGETREKVSDQSMANNDLKSPDFGFAHGSQKTLPAVPHLQPNSRPDSDSVSVASSATLHPNVDAQPPSPSQDDEDFHTPLQTPTVASKSQQDELPKPKKKKPKKKKKTATALQTQDGTTNPQIAGVSDVYAGHGDALGSFSSQLSHIDAVRAATKDPTTYYNITNREMATKNNAVGAAPKGTKVSSRP
ncbi:hypothetical protein DE146DRAFT_782706 [Phaeosphaeria sp. MPI-PUGE-AT-0046c]|nr:hypothetical protein DE146DRAFT_782706 [Phaeosphaeria sp. MPI-PUGE-AT-0046c]